MRKIVLGQTPKNFKRLVTVTLPDGEQTEMGVTFKYRTRTEVAKLAENISAITAEGKDVNINSYSEFVLVGVEDDADALMQVLDDWDLESEFNRENVVQFCDEMPQAGLDILQSYFYGSSEKRQGN